MFYFQREGTKIFIFCNKNKKSFSDMYRVFQILKGLAVVHMGEMPLLSQ